ncbi:MAG: hypothetical protein E6713_06010 [Sporomusaceae bacterium]|nr:hypothetical protein [Sporomusaceae bacterium]
MSVALDQMELTKQVELLKRQHVACLGDNEVFVKRLATGQIRTVKGNVKLSESASEIAVIQNKAMTTAKGFYHANQIAGLSIITPQNLTLPTGEVVVNPYPIIDMDSQTIRKIWVKKMAIGYGPTGNLVITSATLLYDINMYFIQDLIKKVQYNADAGRICMENMLTDDERKTGIFYKIDGTMGVWAKVAHKDILKCIDTFVNKKQFAERNAQTIAERLAMQKHPALAHIAYVDAKGNEKQRTAQVGIIGYVHELTQDKMLDIAEKAERGEEICLEDGQKADVIETTATASVDDMAVEKDDEETMAAHTTPEQTTANQNGGVFF